MQLSEMASLDVNGTLSTRIVFKTQKYGLTSAGLALMLGGVCLYGAGAIDLLRTLLIWLRTGSWETLRTSVVVLRLLGSSDVRLWVESPGDWIGLHTALDTVFLRWPWFAVSIVCGLALFACGVALFLRAEDVE